MLPAERGLTQEPSERAALFFVVSNIGMTFASPGIEFPSFQSGDKNFKGEIKMLDPKNLDEFARKAIASEVPFSIEHEER